VLESPLRREHARPCGVAVLDSVAILHGVSEPNRLTLSDQQAALLQEIIAERRPSLVPLAERVARGEVIPDIEADDLTSALADVMMEDEWSEDTGFTPRGAAIDDLLGVVRQMSDDFYR
jgi:hypothetical protein